MAAALGVRFGGPRSYDGERVELPYMGEGRDDMTRKDVADGLKVMSKALWFVAFSMLLVAQFT